jgi:PAS domain S-box-containing protein
VQHDGREAIVAADGAGPPILRPIEDLQAGDHLCCIYASEEEYRAAVIPFLREGLDRGDKVLYIVDARTADTIKDYLREVGLPADPLLESGQLAILTGTDTFARDGVFDPAAMIELLGSETDRALAEGYVALRVTGEMTWALRGLPGSDLLIDYETRLNGIFSGSAALVLCQYDRRRFNPSLLLDVLRTHPHVVIGAQVVENPYYLPPRDSRNPDRPPSDLSSRTRNLSPECAPVIEAAFRRAGEEGEPYDLELEFDRADGERIWVRTTGSPVVEAGRVIRVTGDIMDISDRKRDEDRLRASEARYRMLVENAPAAVYLHSLETRGPGRVLEVNGRACEMLGYTRAEFLAMNVGAIDTPEMDERAPAMAAELLAKGRIAFETEHVRKDGSRVPVEIRASIVDLDGDPTVLSVVSDITARKRTEAVMAARLRISEYASGHSLDELIQKALDETEAVTGSTIGFFHFVDPDQRSLVLQTWSSNTLAGGCSAQAKGSNCALDEAGVWVDCVRQGRPLVHNDYASLPNRRGLPEGHSHLMRELTVPVFRDGKIPVILGVGNKPTDYDDADVDAAVLLADLILDTVEAKRAEQALRESEANLAALIGNTKGMIWAVDPDYRLIVANPAFINGLQAATGQPVELGTSVLMEKLPKEDRDLWRKWYDLALLGKSFHIREGSRHTETPSIIDYAFDPIVSPDETISGVVISGRDITELMEAEEDLRQLNESLEERVTDRTRELSLAVEELTEANAAKTRFLRSMSHELRTPLNSVIGFSSVMLDGLTGEVNDEQRRQLAMINNSGKHLLALINDILDLSRIEAGKVEVRPETIGVRELLEELIASVAPAASEKGLDLRLMVPDPAPSLESDRTKVSQILLNLLDNAIKFTESGSVTLRASRLSAHLVAFSVSDTGPGIPPEARTQIFGEFVRAASHGPATKGTGLGLAISRGLAGSLGGTVCLETAVGLGSTFTLTLPEGPAHIARDRPLGSSSPRSS